MRRQIRLGIMLGLCGCAGGARAPWVVAATVPSLTAMVPMRDGVHLATDVYLPAGSGPWPVVLVRTPYSKANVGFNGLFPPSRFVENSLALVIQDTRGRFASEGKARPWIDDGWGEHSDGVDTVSWVRQQYWCNGKIATYGKGYVGATQLMLAGAGPEGLVGQHVGAGPISSYHYRVFRNGVFLGMAMQFLQGNKYPPEAFQLYLQHPHYDDFWQQMDLSTRVDQVRWPLVFLGGWFDAFLQGEIDAFTALQENGGPGAQGHQQLVIGPWTEDYYSRKAGELTFPANALGPPGAPDPFQWLSFWLTGQPKIPDDEPAVRYYVMGDVKDESAPGNLWRSAESWPPPSRPLRLYFTAEGGMESSVPATAATREYDYDPARPVPTLVDNSGGPADQRDVEKRRDVLLFTSQPLTEPLEITGRLSVRLYAASSAPDTDFTAKLTDVYPNGRSMLLADGIVRARYRQSLEREELITPGQQYSYDIDLWSTSIIFNRGHRIRVAISSSNAPRFEPNTNTGEPWPFTQTPVVVHQTIFLGGTAASHIVLPEAVGP